MSTKKNIRAYLNSKDIATTMIGFVNDERQLGNTNLRGLNGTSSQDLFFPNGSDKILSVPRIVQYSVMQVDDGSDQAHTMEIRTQGEIEWSTSYDVSSLIPSLPSQYSDFLLQDISFVEDSDTSALKITAEYKYSGYYWVPGENTSFYFKGNSSTDIIQGGIPYYRPGTTGGDYAVLPSTAEINSRVYSNIGRSENIRDANGNELATNNLCFVSLRWMCESAVQRGSNVQTPYSGRGTVHYNWQHASTGPWGKWESYVGSSRPTSSRISYSANTWYQMAYGYDSTDNKIKVYVNGEKIYELSTTNPSYYSFGFLINNYGLIIHMGDVLYETAFRSESDIIDYYNRSKSLYGY